MTDEAKAEAQPPDDVPPAEPMRPISNEAKARARVVRRTLVGLSVAAIAFAGGAFLYRRYHRLPEVPRPAFQCRWSGEPQRREEVLTTFETEVSGAPGLGTMEVVARTGGFDASIFPAEGFRGRQLWEAFPLMRDPWVKGAPIEKRTRYVTVVGGRLSAVERYTLVAMGLSPELQRIPGVAAVDLCGGARPETRVTLAMDRVRALGVTTPELSRAVALEPAMVIRAAFGEEDSLKKLLERPVTGAVHVRDLARIEATSEPSPCGAFRGESEELLVVRVQPAADDLSDAAVAAALEAYEKKAPPAVHLRLLGYDPKSRSAPHPAQIELKLPLLARNDVPKLQQKLRSLSDEAMAYVLADATGVEALMNVPPSDGRKPEEYERFLQNELSRAFGCVYSANVPVLRLRLSSGADVWSDAKRFIDVARTQSGVLAAEVVSPPTSPSYILQTPRVLQLGLLQADVWDAFAMATEGKSSLGMRIKGDLPLERTEFHAPGGAHVPMTELFERDDRVRSALRVNRRAHADVCVTSASSTPEELAERLVPLARRSGFDVAAARWVVR